ncbi:MAG: RluA family pseudouridine synthase [Thermovirgaceae bacterium]|nr:RluA family pseudouridine synthase [Thermovirgaceae bacterium]
MGQAFKISKHDDGRRIDKIIRKMWPDLPLSALMRAFRKGMVRIDGHRSECSVRVTGGQTVELPWDDAVVQHVPGLNLQAARTGANIEIIYADRDICIVNKPWNLLAQPNTRGGESVISRVASTLEWNDDSFSPTPAHRLDRNTSGALALALSGTALRSLHEAWRTGKVKKTYLAIVAGNTPKEGEINSPLLKKGEDNIVVVDRVDGQAALTRFRKLEGDGSVSLLLVELMTGRPHQARVHLASLGFPLIGDLKYGSRRVNDEWKAMNVNRPLLHSRCLDFQSLGDPLAHLSGKRFLAVPATDFLEVLSSRGWRLYDRGV